MNVKIYSTPTCPNCNLAKEYLKEKNIPFEIIDVAEDPAKAEEMVQKSGQMSVPVILVDENIIVGFDKEKLNQALGL